MFDALADRRHLLSRRPRERRQHTLDDTGGIPPSKPVCERFGDRLVRPRLTALASDAAVRIIAVECLSAAGIVVIASQLLYANGQTTSVVPATRTEQIGMPNSENLTFRSGRTLNAPI